jgi:hypothetical protein
MRTGVIAVSWAHWLKISMSQRLRAVALGTYSESIV